jgi:plastocyanin
MRHLALAICVSACAACAADISGRIVLKKNIERNRVNAAVYNLRGIAVDTPAVPQKASTLSHTAVWLESSITRTSAPPVNVAMQQTGRRFQPDLLVVPAGSTVEFPNLDPIFHNIFSLSHAQSFDLGYYSEGKSRHVTFARPGVIQVYCHIHANMYAVVVVAPSPWFGVPDSNGLFSFTGVPPGDYRLAVWQRASGLHRKKLAISDSGTVRVQISLPEERDE